MMLAIGRLMSRPKLLLLDEPSLGLVAAATRWSRSSISVHPQRGARLCCWSAENCYGRRSRRPRLCAGDRPHRILGRRQSVGAGQPSAARLSQFGLMTSAYPPEQIANGIILGSMYDAMAFADLWDRAPYQLRSWRHDHHRRIRHVGERGGNRRAVSDLYPHCRRWWERAWAW